MYNIMYESSRQSRFNARYWMLGAGALGRPRGMVWGGRREEGSSIEVQGGWAVARRQVCRSSLVVGRIHVRPQVHGQFPCEVVVQINSMRHVDVGPAEAGTRPGAAEKHQVTIRREARC